MNYYLYVIQDNLGTIRFTFGKPHQLPPSWVIIGKAKLEHPDAEETK